MTVNRLFLRKLLIAFLVGFGGVFIPAVLTVLQKVASGTPSGFDKAFLIALISGAVAAGLRALLVLTPGINIVPSDKEPIVTTDTK